MTTNLLSLPLLNVTFETATNESWRDSVAFTTAGPSTSFPSPGNSGSGSVSGLMVLPGAYIGDYTITLTSPTQYRVTDPDGYTVGAGVTGVPFYASGLSMTLLAGTAAFAAGDSFTITVLPRPLDITGIRFVMQMRASSGAALSLVTGDTDDGTLVNGLTSGVLGLAIPEAVMARVPISPTGAPYVLDIIGIADGDQRRCVSGTNAVISGITFPLST